MLDKIRELIYHYQPYNEQEIYDKNNILRYLDCFDGCLSRDNGIGHFSATAWIINANGDKVLMVYHNIYQSFSWVGGHVDGNSNLIEVAIKEAREETGINNLKLLQEEAISIAVLPVNPHYKNGKYIGSHMHLDVCFLFEADDQEMLRIKEDENSDVRWIDNDDILDIIKEENMKPIYQKIIDKVKIIKEK